MVRQSWVVGLEPAKERLHGRQANIASGGRAGPLFFKMRQEGEHEGPVDLGYAPVARGGQFSVVNTEGYQQTPRVLVAGYGVEAQVALRPQGRKPGLEPTFQTDARLVTQY